MLKHVIVLLFLYGIKDGSGSSPQDELTEPKGVSKNGIKKNEVGANGLDEKSREILRNFRNPVLEYLLSKGSERANGPPKKGIIREIRHSQTLLVPNFPRGIRPLPDHLINQLPDFQEHTKPTEEVTKTPEKSPLDNFWDYLKNKTGNKSHESVVTSPVLHLNKNSNENREEWTRIQTYPAVGVVINTFNKDGSLKNSVTHFQPDFNSLRSDREEKGATYLDDGINRSRRYNSQYSVNDFPRDELLRQQSVLPRQGLSWPLAGYFPIVINDPFLSFYNAFASSMYNAVSSMVEYGPEADICRKDKDAQEEVTEKVRYNRKEEEILDSNVFDEVTMKTEQRRGEKSERRRRDATSIFLKSRQGDRIDITLEEPPDSNEVDERARSFSQALVNTPPLSTILRPPHQESRQFLGYADKKRKAKPSKPIKEEGGSSEEVGEEHEEESTGQTQENANEAVAISPPPEGASVAEAKPIGLAIAGPGGVAASKPQGTAVAGPGGLAIARPVGTAIAGVEVEGSVPIGGQQKNKKKPKQEQEQTEGELHYVGGLTGPIGNPQPKEFADKAYYKSVRDTEGNNIQENLFFRGRQNSNGYQLKLGQENGKYGFIPMFASPVQGTERLQKRMDSPTFFHGLLGNGAQGNDQFQNYQMQF